MMYSPYRSMKKIQITLILSFSFLLCSNLQAQITKELRQERKEARIEERRIKNIKRDSLQSLPIDSYIFWDFSVIFPNENPRLNVGYIHKINEKWSVGTSAGIGLEFANLRNVDDYKLWEVRPQVVFNLGKGRRFQHFLSAEAFFIRNSETRFNGSFRPINDNNGEFQAINYTRADYGRIKQGLTINYGEYINISSSLALRTTVGFGFRYKDVSFSNIQGASIDFNSDDFFLFDDAPREGLRSGIELNFSFQLLYKL